MNGGDSIDRYGELMHRLGSIEATQNAVMKALSERAAHDALVEQRLAHLEEYLISGRAVARIVRVGAAIIVSIIATAASAGWAARELWSRFIGH